MATTETLVAEYQRGDTLQTVADRHGISKQAVQRRLESVGVERRDMAAHMETQFVAWRKRNERRVLKLMKQHRDTHSVAELMEARPSWVARVVADSPLAVATLVPGGGVSRQRFTDREILNAIRRAAKLAGVGVPLSAPRYDYLRRQVDPSSELAVSRFHNWGNACRAAGVPHREAARKYPSHWSHQLALSCVRSYVDHCRDAGVAPLCETYDTDWRQRYGGPSKGTISKLFGSWYEAVWEAASS